MKTWIIYSATLIATGQTYVGMTFRSFEQRKNEHLQQARRGKLKRFHHSLHAHGDAAFDWCILAEGIPTLEEACQLEREWIARKQAHVSVGGLNLTEGGEGSIGMKHTIETRKKIGDAFRGKPKSEEQRKKMGAAISAARSGKKYGTRKFKNPEQARENLAAPHRGHTRNLGRRHSPATIAKMRKPHRCSVCKEFGHRRNVCKESPSNESSS